MTDEDGKVQRIVRMRKADGTLLGADVEDFLGQPSSRPVSADEDRTLDEDEDESDFDELDEDESEDDNEESSPSGLRSRKKPSAWVPWSVSLVVMTLPNRDFCPRRTALAA
jgi:hypothetical protein